MGHPHISSGAITSGQIGVTAGTPNGSLFLRDDFTWAAPSVSLTSGQVQSGHIASGAVQGFFGATRHIASGTVGVFDFGSGAVVAGTVGSGAVQGAIGALPNVASGTIGTNDIGSGQVQSGNILSGNVGRFHHSSGSVAGSLTASLHILSGTVGPADLASGSVRGDKSALLGHHISSGSIGPVNLASGIITSGVYIGSGTILGQAGGGPFNIASGTIGQFDLSSGIITSGVYIGSGTILGAQGGGPRNIASGTIGNSDLSSGIITSGVYVGSGTIMGHAGGGPFQIVSGSVTTADIGSGAILSGQIGSGQVGQLALASGSVLQNAYSSGTGPSYILDFVSGLNLNAIITQETVSGVRAVCISTSGHLAVAMASQSGRMPAVGVVFDNVASGIQCNVFTQGTFTTTSGLCDFSGYIGQNLWVGRSGQVVTTSGSWNSGGLLSGDVWQPIGTVALTSGGIDLGCGTAISYTVGQITSGNIASGQIGSTHIASGGVLSGNIGSGQIGTYALASGATVTNSVNLTPLWSGAFFGAVISSEAISGIKAVCIDITSSGGAVRTAMAAVSGRMPAIGVVVTNVLSGIPVNVLTKGTVIVGSGIVASGFLQGKTLWVGYSGDLITVSGGYGSGGAAVLSGFIGQRMGFIQANSSGTTSGLYYIDTQFSYTSGIGSGGPLSLFGQ